MSDLSHSTQKGPTGPFLSACRHLTTLLDWSGRLISVICLAVMFVLLFINVVLRYAAGSGIPWAYEIHAILLPWLVAGGIVVAAAQGRNIAISILPNLISPNALRWLIVFVSMIVFVICVSVIWAGQPTFRAATFQTLATLGLKQVWGYASLIYAFGGMGVIALTDAIRAVLGDVQHADTSLS